MKIECCSVFNNKDRNVSLAKFKRVENGLRNATYWIKNPDNDPYWKNEIFSYPKCVKLEDARDGKSWGLRRYTVHPNYKEKYVFVENSTSTQWKVYFESKTEMDNWLKNVIVTKKYDMTEGN